MIVDFDPRDPRFKILYPDQSQDLTTSSLTQDLGHTIHIIWFKSVNF